MFVWIHQYDKKKNLFIIQRYWFANMHFCVRYTVLLLIKNIEKKTWYYCCWDLGKTSLKWYVFHFEKIIQKCINEKKQKHTFRLLSTQPFYQSICKSKFAIAHF